MAKSKIGFIVFSTLAAIPLLMLITVDTVSAQPSPSGQSSPANSASKLDKNKPSLNTEGDKNTGSTDAKNMPENELQLSSTNQIAVYLLLIVSILSFVLLGLSYLALTKQKTKLEDIELKIQESRHELDYINRIVTQQDKGFTGADILFDKSLSLSQVENATTLAKDKLENKLSEQREDIKHSAPSAERTSLPYDPNNVVSIYNYDAKLLRENITEVISESKDSIQGRMLDNSQPLLLQKDNKGDYWIIRVKQERYMLFPKANFKLNQFNLETLVGLFELQDYYQGANAFQLLRPAQVIPSHGSKYWQVEALGVLKFT